MRIIPFIVVLSLLHFLAIPIVLFFSYASTMSQLNTGERAVLGQEVLSTTLWVLLFPLHLLTSALPRGSRISFLGNGWGMMLVLANSVLWGTALYFLGRRFLARRR